MILENPSRTALQAFLLEHRGLFLQIIGLCEVVYVGRAASLTEMGEYVVKPINWQPRTDSIRIITDEDDRVMLMAERFKPDELVQITFHRTVLAIALTLRDEKVFSLHGSELQMHQALKQDLSVLEDGLTLLEHELPVGVGDIDIYAKDANGHAVVIEVKRSKATHEAVHQLERYVKAVRISLPNKIVRGFIAAPSISKPALKQLGALGLEFKEFSAMPEEEKKAVQTDLFALA
jgi:endonuclease